MANRISDEHKTLDTIDGFRIAAVHTRSEGKAIVLWLHGITVNKNEYLDFFKDGADYLARLGIDSLRIDFRGHGESSGSSLEFSIVGQMLDVRAAMSYLRGEYHDTTRLVLVGCSFGAPPAIFAALEFPDVVSQIVLIAPVISYQRTFLQPETDWARDIFNADKLSRLDESGRLYIDEDFAISPRLVEEMKLIIPEDAIRRVRQPVKIIHGDKDSMVPHRVSADVASKMDDVKFYSISNMDHGFNDRDDENGTAPQSLQNKKEIFEIVTGGLT